MNTIQIMNLILQSIVVIWYFIVAGICFSDKNIKLGIFYTIAAVLISFLIIIFILVI